MTGVLMKRRNVETDTNIGRTPCEHEDRHLNAQERGLAQILPSQPSAGTNSANILISDILLPKLRQ